MQPTAAARPAVVRARASAAIPSGSSSAGTMCKAAARTEAMRDGVPLRAPRGPAPQAKCLPQPDVPGGPSAIGSVRAPRHLIGGVALDRVDLAVGVDGLDDPDVARAPDDELARRRLRGGAAGALRPVPHRADRAEALALLAERGARLARRPGGEVRAPRVDAAARRGRAVLGAARRVVGAGRLLGLTDFPRRGLDHPGRAAGRGTRGT